jgi:hypothetical protein
MFPNKGETQKFQTRIFFPSARLQGRLQALKRGMRRGSIENFCVLHFVWNSLLPYAFGSIFKERSGGNHATEYQNGCA